MIRRRFLKSCLGGLCLSLISVLKYKPKNKPVKAIIYGGNSYNGRIYIHNDADKTVEYRGEDDIHPGDVVVWNKDGTVSKPKDFAGVVKCVI